MDYGLRTHLHRCGRHRQVTCIETNDLPLIQLISDEGAVAADGGDAMISRPQSRSQKSI